MTFMKQIGKAVREGAASGRKKAAYTTQFFKQIKNQDFSIKERTNTVMQRFKKTKPRLKALQKYGSNLRSDKYW